MIRAESLIGGLIFACRVIMGCIRGMRGSGLRGMCCVRCRSVIVGVRCDALGGMGGLLWDLFFVVFIMGVLFCFLYLFVLLRV